MFGELYNHPITPGTVPDSVVLLSFSACYQQMIPPGAISNNVKSLVLGFNDLPLCLEPGSIPSTIEFLELGYYFIDIEEADLYNESAELNIPADVIPTTITRLVLNQLPCPDTIPAHITQIDFGSLFNRPIPVGVIPDTVKTIVFCCDFNQPIEPGSIPSSVERLAFGYRFNQPLSSDMLPNSIKYLSFSHFFEQQITQDSLPDSVQFLSFCLLFEASRLISIPRGVTHLTLGHVLVEDLIQRLFPLVIASNITHLSLQLKPDTCTRCFVRCEDGFMHHAVTGCMLFKDSSSWPPGPECKSKLIGKILLSEIEARSLTADCFK